MSRSVLAQQNAQRAAADAPLQSAPVDRDTFNTSLKGVPVALKARWKELKKEGRVYGSFTQFLLESANIRLDDLEKRLIRSPDQR